MDVLFLSLTRKEREVVLRTAERIAGMNISYREGAPPSDYESQRELDCSGFFRRVYQEAVDPDEYVVKGKTPSARMLWDSLEPTDSPLPGDLACYSGTNDAGEPTWHVMLVTRNHGVIGACNELGKVGTHPKIKYSTKWNLLGFRRFPGKSIYSSDALNELLGVRARIDELCADLRKVDSFWEPCFKCPNKGRCCSFKPKVDLNITEPEWHALKGLVNANTILRDYALKRLDGDKHCLFHDFSSDRCLVHDERPLICRLVPFYLYENSGRVFFWNPGNSCDAVSMRIDKESRQGLIHESGYEHIVKFDGRYRIHAGRLDYLLRFCRRYRKRILSDGFEEIRFRIGKS